MAPVPQLRLEALRLAVELYSHREQDDWTGEAVLHAAGEFTAWLAERPHHLRLRPAPFTFEQGSPGPGQPTQTTGAHGMSVSMTDSQQISYACEAEDSKGFPVSDALTWSADDSGAVVTLTPSADGTSCAVAAVAPGTATVSVTDGSLSASDLVTVTPGGVASLVLTPGAVTDQPAAPSA